MNKSKRRIVALSTAFAMAFVMVASLVIGFTSEASLYAFQISLTEPQEGASITHNDLDDIKTALDLTVPANMTLESCDMVDEGGNVKTYPVTYDRSQDNYVKVRVSNNDGSGFNPNFTVTVNGGAELVSKKIDPSSDNIAIVLVKFPATISKLTKASVNVTAPAIDSTMTIGTTQPNITVPDGANYTIDEMRYMTKDDADAIINAQMMAGASTSTTVKENDVYYAQIILKPKAGYTFDVNATTNRPNFEPTVGGDATYYGAGYSSGNSVQFFVKVTVPKASAPVEPVEPSVTPTPSTNSDIPVATQTTTTTTTAAAATPTTETATATTKTAPKTGDAMPIVAITFVVVGASAIGVVIYRRYTHKG